MLTMLDLFSGIGGFSLAASWTGGIKTVMFCEIEPFCQKVLKQHWPDVPIHDDIRTLRGEDVGTVDIVCGGFPCQPFSCAGKQRGKEDDRYLWPEMFRVIQETKPTWVIGENVANFVNMALEDCVLDLEGEGYEVQPFIIPACAIGAPHRRDRVWIVAWNSTGNRNTKVRTIREGENAIPFGICQDVADTESRKSGEQESRNRREGIGRGSEKVIDVADTSCKLREWDRRARDRRSESPNGSWRAIESRLGEHINGIPAEMDGDGINANTEKAGPRKILSVLQKEIKEKDLQWATGGYGSVQTQEVLQSILHGKIICQRCALKIGIIEACGTIPWELLRSVWGYETNTLASHRRESFKRLAREYSDLMRQLSCYPPPPCPSCWIDGSWEDDIPRVATGVKNRVDRLKCLGNAVVPQQVYPIFQAIVDIEEGRA